MRNIPLVSLLYRAHADKYITKTAKASRETVLMEKRSSIAFPDKVGLIGEYLRHYSNVTRVASDATCFDKIRSVTTTAGRGVNGDVSKARLVS